MKQMPFEPPTDHYDERVAATDEQICQLIQQRKRLSDNNPGFPPKAYIAEWAENYGFYEEFLNGVFSTFIYEEVHKPMVEPENFQKNIPIMKSFEKDGNFYSVPLVQQFENASIVILNVTDKYMDNLNAWHAQGQGHRPFLVLYVEGHECRMEGGGGSMGNESHTYIVTPALPDDKEAYELVFKEQKNPFQKGAGDEFII